jgi:hypothetical protein
MRHATTVLLLSALLPTACASGDRGHRGAAPVEDVRWTPHPVATERVGRPGTITATVVHTDGRPVVGATLRLFVERDGRMQRTREVGTTDGLGRAVLDADGPGLYRVALEETPGVEKGWLLRGSPWHAFDVLVRDSAGAGHGGTLVAPRGAALEVTVARDGLWSDEAVSVSLRHRTPAGDFRSPHSAKPPVPVRDAAAATETRLFERLPEGEYEVRVGAPELRVAHFERVAVTPGRTARLVASLGEPGPLLRVSYDGPPSSERSDGRQRLWLNPYDGRAALVRGPLEPEPLESRAAEPGRYVAILPDLAAAMAVELREVGAGSGWHVRLRPPSWLDPGEGRTVTVRVLRGHERLLGAFVALALPAERHLRSGQWMRTHTGGRTHFENVPPGDWDVLVVNGVYQWFAGLPPLTVRRVRVGRKDVVVTVQVPAP